MRRMVGVIPARMAASRFPGKPLAQLCGRPMIEHVYWRTRLCGRLDEVYVATCDRDIAEAVERFGGRVAMTSSAHERASDRVGELARSTDADVIVMVQGDEPMIVPEMIDLAVEPFMEDSAVVCVNLVAPIETEEDFLDPNTIKVVMDRDGNALYFSREAVPTRHRIGFAALPVYKQVCVIPFRRDFLLTYTALAPTPLEQAESIDMLRALEHGYAVRLVPTPYRTQSVDAPEDLARVEALMHGDALLARYGSRVAR